MSTAALIALPPRERRRLAKSMPGLSADQPAWVVSTEHSESLRSLLELIVRGEERFEKVVQNLLPDSEVPTAAAVLQARRNAEARAELAAEFGLLTSGEVAELAGSTAENRAALASRWKREGKIWSVPYHGQQLWPGFQFDDAGQPRPVIAGLLSTFHESASPWEKALWMISANGWLDGRRPADLLVADPEAVLEAAVRESDVLST